MTEFRKGDIVTLRGRVEYAFSDDNDDGNSSVTVTIDGHYKNVYVSPHQLTFVHHMFKIGDRVRGERSPDGRYYHSNISHVRAVNGDFAWVENEDGYYATIALRNLEHAPPIIEPTEELAL
jgi:hypothetical protein